MTSRRAVAVAAGARRPPRGGLGGYIGPHTPYGLPLAALKQYPQFGDDMAQRQGEAKWLVAAAG